MHKVCRKLPARDVVIQGEHDLAFRENRVVLVGFFEIEGKEMGYPALAVYDVRSPAQLLYRLQNAAGKENGPLVIVGKELSVLVTVELLSLEVILVVDEVHLRPCLGNGGNLDNQRTVGIVDYEVHAGEPDDLVKLVLALVDAAVAWHESTDFLVFLLCSLREIAAYGSYFTLGKIGIHLRANEKYFLCRIVHLAQR